MESLTWDMAKAFYDKHYGPNNAILIVTGDITGPEVLDLAQEHYGDLSPITVPQRTRAQIPPLHGQVSLSEITPDIQQGQISLLFRAPSYTQNKNMSLALDIVQEIMSGGASSRLYQSLVVKQKYATAISLSYNGTALNDALISANAYPAQGITPDTLKNAILGELSSLAANGITDQELQTAKQKAQDAAIFARDSLMGPALIIGQAMTTGATLDSVEYWAHDIAQVTKEDILQAAALYLNPSAETTHMTFGAIMPPSINKNDSAASQNEGEPQ